ncbi:kama family protein [Aspergillus californicus]
MIPSWKDTNVDEFTSHKWQIKETIKDIPNLSVFLESVLPARIPPQRDMDVWLRVAGIETRENLIVIKICLSPHVLSIIDWSDPLNDPIRRQVLPLPLPLHEDHPKAVLDKMYEAEYSPIEGLICRYPDCASLIATSNCSVFCRFCLRSCTVSTETETAKEMRYLPIRNRWRPQFDYIAQDHLLKDIIVTGGDTYSLTPSQLKHIGEALLDIPHVRRVRFETKGLGASPSRLIDRDDRWVDTVFELHNKAQAACKHICIMTYFNHPKEVTWVTRQGARRLYESGVTVRNQSMLMNWVNNNIVTMTALVNASGNINIQPYYVCQGDFIPGMEDLRTPLRDGLDLEYHLRGTTTGFLTPNFVVGLPGQGGKRLISSWESYDKRIGLSKFMAPGLKGKPIMTQYWDPLWSLTPAAKAEVLTMYGKR